MSKLSYNCPDCNFSLYNPIISLSSTTLGLYDDVRYPGRCLLVLNEHHEDFSFLDPEKTAAFINEMKLCAQAIKVVASADRINYAILGNAEPHLHAHLIPRIRATDPVPNRSPWNHPNLPTKLPKEKKEDIIKKIASAVIRLRNT